MTPPIRTYPERFWSKVDRRGPDDCWPWLGAKLNGYGRFWPRKRESMSAHRFAYMDTIGPIPIGLVIDHLCRNTICVNPAHLEPVTSGTNTLRGVGWTAVNARKTHCFRGHSLSADGYLYAGSYVRRICGRCRALYNVSRRPDKVRMSAPLLLTDAGLVQPPDSPVHALTFILPADLVAAGYTASCEVCGGLFRTALDWLESRVCPVVP